MKIGKRYTGYSLVDVERFAFIVKNLVLNVRTPRYKKNKKVKCLFVGPNPEEIDGVTMAMEKAGIKRTMLEYAAMDILETVYTNIIKGMCDTCRIDDDLGDVCDESNLEAFGCKFDLIVVRRFDTLNPYAKQMIRNLDKYLAAWGRILITLSEAEKPYIPAFEDWISKKFKESYDYCDYLRGKAQNATETFAFVGYKVPKKVKSQRRRDRYKKQTRF